MWALTRLQILTDRVHVPQDEVQPYVDLLLAVYAGSSVILSPVSGYIADRTTSRQAPFLFGLSALLVATGLLFTGSSLPVLIVARIGQGASSAFVWTIGLTLCIDTVGPENLGKTIGSIFSFITIGALFSPVIGGALYEKASYAAVGILAISVLAVDFLMRVLVIEKKIAARYDTHDRMTHPSETRHENIEHGSRGESRPRDTEREHDESSPLLGEQSNKDSDTYAISQIDELPAIYRKVPILYPLTHSPSLVVACLTAGVQALLIGSFDATVPTHAKDLFGFSSLQAGLLFIPLGVLNIIVGPLAGWATDRYGVKPLAVSGFAFLVPTLVLLRVPQSEPVLQQSIIYSVILGLCGTGLGVIDSPSIVESGTVIDKYHKQNPGFFGSQGPYAQLYGFNSMVFSAGLTIGPLIAGAKEGLGYGNMTVILACIAGVSAALCFAYLGGKPALLKRA